ncbi:hypothetical protein C0R09_08175 [Brevibacillus laterosporus]|uniref:ABC transporter permease n=1 Tax=Brevibacillus laterosporus TaxID=1465 RepID=UPI000C77505A|nr:ABC-2 family transporter protein [Brevibacillus laterosporus]AUM64506.1 hypothetical protein C0R09_08175 [Brevibacillus laterosporus]
MTNHYYRVIILTLKSEFQYRLNVLIRIIVSLIPLLSIVYMWFALYAYKLEYSGYSFKEMITYTVIAKLLFEIVSPTVNWEIYSQITSGEITKYFIRPLSFLKYWFARNIGLKVVSLIVSSILILTIIIFKTYFLLPSTLYFILFIASCLLSLILFFIVYYIISLLAFWFTDVWAFFFLAGNVISFASGAIIPLNMMPHDVYICLNLMPFSKLIYFPLNIFLQKLSLADIYTNFMIQVMWIVVFIIVAQMVYRFGTKKFDAPGG